MDPFLIPILILTGQSGGPIFDENGLLVAIAVSNFKSSVDNLIYNCHNMCVPVKDIYNTLERYSITRGREIVNKYYYLSFNLLFLLILFINIML